jgi:hypothetical protein
MARKPTPRDTVAAAPNSLQFSAINLVLLLCGLGVIVAGYMMLAGGSIVGAPLLLVLGYAVLLPLGIIR